MRPRKRLPAALVAAGTAVGLVAAPAAQADRSDRAETFEVTITNLTSGQPLTPPVVATHRGKNEVFRVGSKASFELKEIAENGNNGPLLADLGSDRDVFNSFEAPGGPLVPAGKPGSAMFDDTTTFTISAHRGARRISFASMLICTNDGFTGLNSLQLPRRVGESVTAGTMGYDAGTEANTEDFADMVPPCQGLIGVSSGEAGTGTSDPALAQNDVIRHHRGVTGRRDLLTSVHGWDVNAPVAAVTVEGVG
jgi:Spondin_N